MKSVRWATAREAGEEAHEPIILVGVALAVDARPRDLQEGETAVQGQTECGCMVGMGGTYRKAGEVFRRRSAARCGGCRGPSRRRGDVALGVAATAEVRLGKLGAGAARSGNVLQIRVRVRVRVRVMVRVRVRAEPG